MKLLLDTQLLLWAAGQPEHLPARAKRQLNNPRNELFFSAVSLCEITSKNAVGRDDFRVEPRVLRRALLDNGYVELPITSEHAANVDGLPPLYKDPEPHVRDVHLDRTAASFEVAALRRGTLLSSAPAPVPMRST